MPTSEDEDIEWEVEAESPAGAGPSIVAPHDERARAILAGFKINWMNMSDAGTGEVLWRDDGWGDLMTQRDIHIPKSILKCRAVSREFQFSSVEMLQTLRLEQRIFFNGSCLEGAHRTRASPCTLHPHPSISDPAPCARRVALQLRVRHPPIDQHVAADDRGRRRVQDDPRITPQVSPRAPSHAPTHAHARTPALMPTRRCGRVRSRTHPRPPPPRA